MNRITKRTWIVGLFLGVLLCGLLLFVGEYVTDAEKWVSFSGSPHLYNSSNIGCGTITDRSGQTLLSIAQGRTYSDNAQTRKSTLHWLGDRNGFINAAAVSTYAGAMAGYDRINGVYDASGEGGTARLTLSAKVQNAALEAMGSRKGTVAVYNYKTGEILCALTTPTYDPENVPDIASDTTGAYDGVYLNRFVQSSYVPGSIFKIVTLSAALDCVPGIEEKTFPCKGKLTYGSGSNTEAVTCEKAHGNQSIKQAFANSCNCAFAQIAELVGKDNMVKYVRQFQVTQRLSFDGITTAAGNYDISNTGAVSFAWSCIGQHSDLVNPARYMTFMGAIANGGVGMEPYLMAQVENGGKTTYQAKAVSTDRLMPESVAETVKAYMRNNVKTVYGDGNFGGLPVCAKSGTSQLGGDQKSNAMFAGFVDSDQYPLAFMVVVENGGYGSHTCVPVISKVLAACKSVMDH